LREVDALTLGDFKMTGITRWQVVDRFKTLVLLDRRPTAFTTMRYTNRQPLPLSGLTLFFINMKQRLSTISVNTRYCVIFACLYWKSRGISCGLESGHPGWLEPLCPPVYNILQSNY